MFSTHFLCYNTKDRVVDCRDYMNSKRYVIAMLLGVGVYAVIMTAYFILGAYIDLETIKDSLTSGTGVTAQNFVYVAIYISFVNSLLEEFFFSIKTRDKQKNSIHI